MESIPVRDWTIVSGNIGRCGWTGRTCVPVDKISRRALAPGPL
jgi:hypothetical protein